MLAARTLGSVRRAGFIEPSASGALHVLPPQAIATLPAWDARRARTLAASWAGGLKAGLEGLEPRLRR